MDARRNVETGAVSPAKLLTNRFLARCGQLWPDTVRLEETGVGDAVPMAFVHQAVACIEAGNPRAAIPILRKRVKFGVKGKTDLSGFVLRRFGDELVPHALACEVKAGHDRISEDQQRYHDYLRSFFVIVIIVRDDFETAISELAKWAGEPWPK